jgi:hypothetical protein
MTLGRSNQCFLKYNPEKEMLQKQKQLQTTEKYKLILKNMAEDTQNSSFSI